MGRKFSGYEIKSYEYTQCIPKKSLLQDCWGIPFWKAKSLLNAWCPQEVSTIFSNKKTFSDIGNEVRSHSDELFQGELLAWNG